MTLLRDTDTALTLEIYNLVTAEVKQSGSEAECSGVDGRDFVTLAGIHTNVSLPLCKQSTANPSHGEATRKIRHYGTRPSKAPTAAAVRLLLFAHHAGQRR